jgi:hypothetical protein
MNAETQFSPIVPKLAMKSLIKKYNFDKAPPLEKEGEGGFKGNMLCYNKSLKKRYLRMHRVFLKEIWRYL